MKYHHIYYFIKPLIPRHIQIILRRQVVSRKRSRYAHIWPIDENSARLPPSWQGWPGQKKFALVLTHDVDTLIGYERCHELISLEKMLGFRSSFNFVPLRYNVSKKLLEHLCQNGFEIGLHGLRHDGKLYQSRTLFQERAKIINEYLREWDCVGFRSPSMHHNLEWIHDLNILYDSSTFDTDPFEPQPSGVGTIFPFHVRHDKANKGYIELPYTIPQDFTLFVLMKEPGIHIWKRKLDWIAEKGGMALINTHPDYMNFKRNKMTIEEYPVRHYSNFLEYVRTNYEGEYWHALPREVASFWSEHCVIV